jgi:polyisoprenoid-binding protein YceI
LTVRTTKAGVGARLAHDLVLEAKVWRGSLRFDPSDLADSYVEVSVDARSLEVVDSSGGLKPLSDGDRAEISKNINQKALKTHSYPSITFCSTSFSGRSGSFVVDGELTIMATTNPVSLRVTTASDGQVEVRATVLQTQFGIKPFSAMLGALRIADEVEIRATLMPAGR